MAVGKSGRVVLEIDAEDKEALHREIKKRGLTMKEWFLEKVEQDFPELVKKRKQKA
jgi:hypothetical protein